MKRTTKQALCVLATAALALSTTGCEKFANCDELRVKFPHGVALPGAFDAVGGGGAPVTTFEINEAYYKFNTGLDRDGDGVACEQA